MQKSFCDIFLFFRVEQNYELFDVGKFNLGNKVRGYYSKISSRIDLFVFI